MPDKVFGARVRTPSASILNGPVVIAVTSVFDAVTAAPFSLSFVVTFPTVTVVNAFGTAVNEESSCAQISELILTESETSDVQPLDVAVTVYVPFDAVTTPVIVFNVPPLGDIM
ncbi:hypothetical protein BSF42_17830 [Flavobacterium sp. ACN6]|nr:hypothetical protein BSF42_17830 [Flavobacterium sp. ACN6]